MRKVYVENNDFEESTENYLKNFRTLGSEVIPSEKARDRVTAKAIYAKNCDPCYNAAAMDGIAVFAENTLTASDKSPLKIVENEDFLYINTGNPVPAGFDAVIMIEDVVRDKFGNVFLREPARPFQNVRVVGESVAAAEMILPSHSVIRPIDIGAILASGNDETEVIKRPRVGIIPTGSEMVETAGEVMTGKLRESNTRVFAALTETYGGIPARYDICPDAEKDLEMAVKVAVAENDVVVVNAGSSAGTKDYTVRVLEKLGKVHTHGLAVKPGKPAILGEINGKPVLGVPGYPVSAYIIFEKVVRRVIEKLGGRREIPPKKVEVELTRRIPSTLKSLEFVRVAMGEAGGRLVASPLSRGAAAVMSMVKADGIIAIARNSEGLEAGEKAEAELLKPLSEIRKNLVVIGSHDMIIDVIGDRMPLSSAHVGSLGGIFALRAGACDIAPIHLLDPDAGVYNLSYIEKYFGSGKTALIKGVGRIQGFMVPSGNPLGIRNAESLCGGRISFANRQRGSGTRILFDFLLDKKRISSEEIRGYDKEFTTHLAVATAVKSGGFDCGLGVKSAAKAFGLDFIPVGIEEYDFLCHKEFLDAPKCKKFIEIITSDEFKAKLDEMTGYDYGKTGEIIFV